MTSSVGLLVKLLWSYSVNRMCMLLISLDCVGVGCYWSNSDGFINKFVSFFQEGCCQRRPFDPFNQLGRVGPRGVAVRRLRGRGSNPSLASGCGIADPDLKLVDLFWSNFFKQFSWPWPCLSFQIRETRIHSEEKNNPFVNFAPEYFCWKDSSIEEIMKPFVFSL